MSSRAPSSCVPSAARPKQNRGESATTPDSAPISRLTWLTVRPGSRSVTASITHWRGPQAEQPDRLGAGQRSRRRAHDGSSGPPAGSVSSASASMSTASRTRRAPRNAV